MSKSTHTPGPWFIDEKYPLSIMAPDGREFEPPWLIANAMPDIDSDDSQGIANARLIASAPYLLEALKGMVEADHLGVKLNVRKREHYSWMVAESIARKAILQAEGG
jgi:hypothetical protein